MTSRCLHCGETIEGLAQFCENCASLDDDPFTPRRAPAVGGPLAEAELEKLGKVAPPNCPSCGAGVPESSAYFCAACARPVRVLEHAGFGIRFMAFLIDLLIAIVIISGTFLLLRDESSAIAFQVAIGALYTIAFWIVLGATPGKLVVGVRIVTSEGDPLTLSNCVLRYLGYIASALALFIGYLMIGFHPEKRGLHDLIGGTVVVRVR